MAMLQEVSTQPPRPEQLNALLGKGSAFEGKLLFEGTVRIDGKWCMDCGVADDTPISRALRLGAETVGAAQRRSRRAAELAQHCSEDGAARVEVAAALWSGR